MPDVWIWEERLRLGGVLDCSLEITAVLGGSLYRAVEINVRSQDQFNRDLHSRETEESEVCIL